MSQSAIATFVGYFQEVLRLTPGMNADKENTETQNSRSSEHNLNLYDGPFHAVFIPRELDEKGDSNEKGEYLFLQLLQKNRVLISILNVPEELS